MGLEQLTDINLALIGIAFFVAGCVKGVLGFGTPLIVIPVVTALFDVVTALVIVAIPTLIPNLWQMWQFRRSSERQWQLAYLLAGMLPGIAIGVSILSKYQASTLLPQMLGLMIFFFLISRSLKIDRTLSATKAKQVAFPAGVATGFLAGTVGITAPVTLTYLVAQRLPRRCFIFQVSTIFAVMGGLQAIFFHRQNLVDFNVLMFSVLGLLPLFVGMWIGQMIGGKISESIFEKLVYCVLGGIGLKLVLVI